MTFEEYLRKLVKYEGKKVSSITSDREKLLMYSGVRLNWQGDFFANEDIKYKKVVIPVEKILFTSTEPDWNYILIKKCNRSVSKFREMVSVDHEMKKKFEKESSRRDFPVILRGPYKDGYYKVLDGMHRFVGKVLKGDEKVVAFLAVNFDREIPFCEAHTVYDLIRGYQRNAKDKEGKENLFHGLCLLKRSYGNVENLLKNRFNKEYINDEEVQEVIKRVLNHN